METENTVVENNQAVVTKQKSNLIPIIGVVALLILVGIGAYVLGKSSQNNAAMQKASQVSNTTQSPAVQKPSSSMTTASPAATTTPTPDPTASWKTYTNQKYGYSIKYPSNLLVNEFDESYAQYAEFTQGRDPSGAAYLADYTVTVAKEDFQAQSPASVNFMSSDWTNSFYTMNVGDTKTDAAVTFKKLPSEKVAGQNAVVIQIVGDKQKRYLVKNNGYVYMISDFIGSPYFPNALPTFKFIN